MIKKLVIGDVIQKEDRDKTIGICLSACARELGDRKEE